MDYPEDVLRIPLEKLYNGCNDDFDGNEDELVKLVEHIIKNGLKEPILVCKGDGEKYEILAGTRRFNAYEKLNKDYPGEGWDEIPALSRGDCSGIDYQKIRDEMGIKK